MKLKLALSLLMAAETAHGFASVGGRPPYSNTVAFLDARSAVRSQTSRNSRVILRGILDEIEGDSYNLLSSTEETDVPMNDAYEVFLGELVFSTNDPRMDIVENFDLATDPKFLAWLENKIEKSRDPDERLALKDLLDMVEDVTTKVKVSRIAEERLAAEAEAAEAKRKAAMEEEAETGRNMSKSDILKKAAAIDAASSGVGDVGEKRRKRSRSTSKKLRLKFACRTTKS